MEVIVSVDSRRASAFEKPSRINARAITPPQAEKASRPACAMRSDCGADSRSVVEIGQPSLKPDLAIQPASSRQ